MPKHHKGREERREGGRDTWREGQMKGGTNGGRDKYRAYHVSIRRFLPSILKHQRTSAHIYTYMRAHTRTHTHMADFDQGRHRLSICPCIYCYAKHLNCLHIITRKMYMYMYIYVSSSHAKCICTCIYICLRRIDSR